MGVIYTAIIGLIILILSPLSYFLLKKAGKKIIGIVVSILLASIVILPIILFGLEGKFYNKTDAREDLKLANIELYDDFEIISNDVNGIPERYQYTTLRLSKDDRNRIINEIKNGENFTVSNVTRLLYEEMWDDNSIRNKVVHTDYLWKKEFVREAYYRHDNYVPTLMIVRLKENSDTLRFTRIEE